MIQCNVTQSSLNQGLANKSELKATTGMRSEFHRRHPRASPGSSTAVSPGEWAVGSGPLSFFQHHCWEPLRLGHGKQTFLCKSFGKVDFQPKFLLCECYIFMALKVLKLTLVCSLYMTQTQASSSKKGGGYKCY